MQRSTSMWYDDGTIVLQAESTQFKVYRGILADNSITFKDMFRVPQPSENALVDGCIVVEMHDTAQDLEYFLDAIHKARSFSRHKDRSIDFQCLSAVLRLSKKYQVDHLWHRYLHVLAKYHPINGKDIKKFISTSPYRAVEYLSLVKILDLPWMEPFAVMRCCSQMTVDELEGNVTNGSPSGYPALSLDHFNTLRCIRIRNHLLTWVQTKYAFMSIQLVPCASAGCAFSRNAARDRAKTVMDSSGNGAALGQPSRAFYYLCSIVPGPCPTCKQTVDDFLKTFDEGSFEIVVAKCGMTLATLEEQKKAALANEEDD